MINIELFNPTIEKDIRKANPNRLWIQPPWRIFTFSESHRREYNQALAHNSQAFTEVSPDNRSRSVQ